MPEKHKTEFTHLAAEFINKESNRQSLITVTGAVLSSDGKRCDILLTVLPEEKEHDVIDFLSRKVSEFRNFVKAQVRGRIIPMFAFVIDTGEKNRQELDRLSEGDKSLE